MALRVAADIGGTFTDFVCLNEETGAIIEEKAHTTPHNFAEGVINAIDKSGISMDEVSYFVHGTTVVINAVTERSGTRTALITTKGFRDVLEIGRGNRPDMYNYFYKKPVPYIPRQDRYEVTERVSFEGEVITPLDEAELREIAGKLRAQEIKSVAVCLMNSYANAEPEKRIAEILGEELPEAEVTISTELLKVWREYERTSTTALNAYVKPDARLYLDTLSDTLKSMGLNGEPHAMQSNGGTATFERAKEVPISLIESGPVGGVIGAAALGKVIGTPNIITFDVGGTTAKTSLIANEEVKITTEYKLEWTPTFAGYPVKSPVVDIIEIGNGGGSIAWVDDVGVLKVGPKSAGAYPGPACYGIGGTEPTLTDANLVTGRINPKNFLGGTFKIDVEKSKEAIRPIAEFYNISIEDAAMGIIQTAASNMLNALKLVSVRRGHNPQDFVMMAQGGNGALLSPYLAAELKVEKCIIPQLPGTFSAWGMLMTDLRQDFMQTCIMPFNGVDIEKMQSIYTEMESEAAKILTKQNIKPEDIIFLRTADIRYVGQEHAVTTPMMEGAISADGLSVAKAKFNELHEMNYNFSLPEADVEFVGFNLTVYGVVQKPEILTIEKSATGVPVAIDERDVIYDGYGKVNCKVYSRETLLAGDTIEGPAIIEESKSVTVLCPKQTLVVDEYGNMHITTEI